MAILYRCDATAEQIAAPFGARAGDDPWAGGPVAPGGFAPVVTAGREFVAGPRPAGKALTPRMVPRLLGVPPPPSAGIADPRRGVLTVRNPESPFWIGNLRNSEFRCLVPATAFMVWGSGTDTEGRRLRHWFAPADQRLFAMAGVWKDSEVPSFALLTTAANAALREKGREVMPVILPPSLEARQVWLHAGWDRAEKLIAPYPGAMMQELEPSTGEG